MGTLFRVQNSRGTLAWERGQHCEIYLQELKQVSIVNAKENSPHASIRGSGKNILCNVPELFSSLTRPVLRRN